MLFLRYARLKNATKHVYWRHTHTRIRSVPPCESKVAASCADADILNYKMKNTVRRNDGTSVRVRRGEGGKQTERDREDEIETRKHSVIEQLHRVDAFDENRHRRANRANSQTVRPVIIIFFAWHIQTPTETWRRDGYPRRSPNDDDNATTSRRSLRHGRLALPLSGTHMATAQSHLYTRFDWLRVYVRVYIDARVFRLTPPRLFVAAHDANGVSYARSTCFHFSRIHRFARQHSAKFVGVGPRELVTIIIRRRYR